MTVLDCRDPAAWGPALDEAVNALRRGDVVVVPTESGYALAADAFDVRAVGAVATLKNLPDDAPLGVLVPDARTLDGLCAQVPAPVRELVTRWWPGPLTVVCRAQPSLAWDLGGTAGTVAVRVPDHDALLALLRRTGPLVVSVLRNPDGTPSGTVPEATTAAGGPVRLALDAGELEPGVASTVVDGTVEPLLLLRSGPVSLASLREVAEVLEPAASGAGPRPDEAPQDPATGGGGAGR